MANQGKFGTDQYGTDPYGGVGPNNQPQAIIKSIFEIQPLVDPILEITPFVQAPLNIQSNLTVTFAGPNGTVNGTPCNSPVVFTEQGYYELEFDGANPLYRYRVVIFFCPADLQVRINGFYFFGWNYKTYARMLSTLGDGLIYDRSPFSAPWYDKDQTFGKPFRVQCFASSPVYVQFQAEVMQPTGNILLVNLADARCKRRGETDSGGFTAPDRGVISVRAIVPMFVDGHLAIDANGNFTPSP